jgi:hypothetical protein
MGGGVERVQGIGGIFFKAADKKALVAWYRDNLGVPVASWGGCAFEWRKHDPDGTANTHWSIFDADTTYMDPGTASFMIEKSEYGQFGWVIDPEGNRVELWQPATSPSRSVSAPPAEPGPDPDRDPEIEPAPEIEPGVEPNS